MSAKRINLQNTPEIKGVTARAVQFDSLGATVRGMLFTPDRRERPLPAVIVTGAWTTIKEQMAGTYVILPPFRRTLRRLRIELR